MADLSGALAWLESHINLEAIEAGRHLAPTLDRIAGLCRLMGDPQHSFPVIHITGTNGKGSVARIVTALMRSKGLTVGTYTSPDLERINERIAWNGQAIDDAGLTEVLGALADLETLTPQVASRFELLTAAAFRYFADVAVDVGVIEVGLGGRWDATNVVSAQVAVVTNVSMDHQAILGPSLRDIAAEKAGIIKTGATLILGETAPDLAAVFKSTAQGAGEVEVWERGADFDCASSTLAHGGRLVHLRTPKAEYPGTFLAMHGAHQGHNAACAVAAAEAFFAAPVEPEVVAEALGTVSNPGRMEVVGRAPLVVLDGAHNPAGAAAASATLAEEFVVEGRRIAVVGFLQGRDPLEMLRALAGRSGFATVLACPPPSPRAMAPIDVIAAAAQLGLPAEACDSVETALKRAGEMAGADDMVLVTGSLYLVGRARHILMG